jgi:hypothetical protein
MTKTTRPHRRSDGSQGGTTGRTYELVFTPLGDGTAIVSVLFAPTQSWLVDETADVRFQLRASWCSPANRRTLAHLHALLGSTVPTWAIRDGFEQARIGELVRAAA